MIARDLKIKILPLINTDDTDQENRNSPRDAEARRTSSKIGQEIGGYCLHCDLLLRIA